MKFELKPNQVITVSILGYNEDGTANDFAEVLFETTDYDEAVQFAENEARPFDKEKCPHTEVHIELITRHKNGDELCEEILNDWEL